MNLISRIGSSLALFLVINSGCKDDKVPVLSTLDVSDVTTSSAICGGLITDEGSSHITTKGVCWSVNENPSVDNDTTCNGKGAASYFSKIAGLTEGTTYFVRAYAINAAGTGYGESFSFTTPDPIRNEAESIQNYLNSNPTQLFVLKSSGLYYLDQVVGSGSVPATHDTAYVKYVGKFLDGTIFTSNLNTPELVFPVNEGYLIAGFDEGITYMREGGVAIFLIPSKLAYGAYGYYAVPGNTPLLFEVSLVKVKRLQ